MYVGQFLIAVSICLQMSVVTFFSIVFLFGDVSVITAAAVSSQNVITLGRFSRTLTVFFSKASKKYEMDLNSNLPSDTYPSAFRRSNNRLKYKPIE